MPYPFASEGKMSYRNSYRQSSSEAGMHNIHTRNSEHLTAETREALTATMGYPSLPSQH